MKKLTIATLITTALSAGAFAGEELDKIDTTFDATKASEGSFAQSGPLPKTSAKTKTFKRITQHPLAGYKRPVIKI